jgi:hypothetical protein
MTRRERKNDRMASQIAARAMGLSYGPSECRRQDADEWLPVFSQQNSTQAETVVPVKWIITRNRGVFENVAFLGA